jgi:phosphotransferase system enzyme I (PtsI)
VLGHLGGVKSRSLSDLKIPSLIVASDLPPSEMALAPRDKILGFATDLGGRTSHTAIMARARGIPAVVGLKGAMDAAREGATALVDGTRGVAIFDPAPDVLEEHLRKQRRYRELSANLASLKDQDCVTLDGRVIHLGANLEVPEELPAIQENGADGVGLYRTEFFYLNRVEQPGEDGGRTLDDAMHRVLLHVEFDADAAAVRREQEARKLSEARALLQNCGLGLGKRIWQASFRII